KSPSRNSNSVSSGMLLRSRRYCCIIGVSASCIVQLSCKILQRTKRILNQEDRKAARTVSVRRCVAFESISDSRLGFDETRPCRIGFDLLPQMCDVDTKILAMFFGFRPPDFAQDLPVR